MPIIDLIFLLVSDAYVTAQTDISCTDDEDPLNSTASLSEPVWWDNYHQVCYGLANIMEMYDLPKNVLQ